MSDQSQTKPYRRFCKACQKSVPTRAFFERHQVSEKYRPAGASHDAIRTRLAQYVILYCEGCKAELYHGETKASRAKAGVA